MHKIKTLIEKIPFYNGLVLPYHWLKALVAAMRYKFPGKKLHVIGVTGTNGKTTTCFMIWKMLNDAGHKAGLMTTVAWGTDKLEPELNHMTTVDPMTLNKRISKIVQSGAEYLVLEVTSHAMAQHRTLGVPFEVAVFTNLTHEHLDYHKTMRRYAAAKAKLFKKAKFGIINADDEYAETFKKASLKYITYGIKNGEMRAENLKMGVSGVKYSCGDIKVETKIPGEFNVYNSLAAVAVGKRLGLSNEQIERGVEDLEAVEGRMNVVDEGQDFTVIVDYAHAPDALIKVFDSINGFKGRIISVHGGAGRRDPSTRPIRGGILGKCSDIVIITEDDSRDEDPEKIAAAFVEGAQKAGKVLDKDLFVELDRAKAIEMALKMAKKGDLVLLLGKGHEKTILRADGPHDFEDVKVARKILKKL
ncbi:UDP-N-acetylmuramoyl-L-alanyl-D-glutamate--2,6-diaminopimelate ligase [Candidatus Saccharibacteria bacterium]|nr:UDP-N-acetylmuramoyl-L-alanyl-D-glutamate--2,6-diaminopimelate ligase [Candidatus Saccharibacteria bacterium]